MSKSKTRDVSTLVQTHVPKPFAVALREKASKEGISVAAWVRRLIMVNMPQVDRRGTHSGG
jgi:hypothetical protein